MGMRRKLRLYKEIVEKHGMICLFSVLPKILTNSYVNLSILALIYQIRGKELSTKTFNEEKFKTILNITLNNDVFLLPSHTCKWIWDDAFLNTTMSVHGKQIKLIDMIRSEDLTHHYLKAIIDHMLDHLPRLLKIKLNLNNHASKILVKNNIARTLIYST